MIVVTGKTEDLHAISKTIMRKLDILYTPEFYQLYKENSTNVRTSLIWYHSSEH